MSRRDQISMTDEELAAFLAEQRTVHVATNGPDGHPHMTTLWYGLYEAKVAFWTYAKSQKVRNLERDDRVTALIEAGDSYSELRGVMLRGRAALLREKAEVMAVAQKVYEANAERFGSVSYQGGQLDRGTMEVLETMSAKRVGIVVEPDDVATWDHRKLGGVY